MHATARRFGLGLTGRSRACVVNVLATLVLLFVLPAVAHADITYIYDRLGRLIGVVDPAGDTAVYHYDAVGNITAKGAGRLSLPSRTLRAISKRLTGET